MPSLIQNLQQVASNLTGATAEGVSIRALGTDVAVALGWTTGSAKLLSAQTEFESLLVTRGFIGPQPAAIFSAGTNRNNGSVLNDVALYAYHASIRWGLVASPEQLLVFNSHWIRQNNWFHLPAIQWNQIDQNVALLEALTPRGVESGRIDAIATNVHKPDRILSPVDDALVERLDYWRAQALRYSTSEIRNVDEALQTLFAQLFILRAVEDRRLSPELPTLRSVCGVSGEVNIVNLQGLFREAERIIGGELFEVETLEVIPQIVLGGIINDLYTPHDLPTNSHYNFAWIDADVLGLAYEKYLSTIFSPLLPPPQSSLFEALKRDIEPISVRKSGGVYYTPPYIVQFLAERCLDKLEDASDIEHLPRIADFACGSGSFLVAAASSLIRRLREKDPSRNWARELVQGRHIIGVDVDERAVIMTQLRLWLRFAEEPDPLPLPSLQQIIIQGDSLGNDVWKDIPESYDVVLGNPPFLATGRTPSRDELSKKFRTAQGRYDYSYLFVELAVSRLAPSGTLGMVVPNRLFRNRDASTIREIITTETDLILVVDFGSNEVFEKTSAYIGSIVAQKLEPLEETLAEYMRVINVKSISSEFLAALLIDASMNEDEIGNEDLDAYNIQHPRGSAPWLLVSPSTRRARTMLEDESDSLSTIAETFQGIRTGANDIFIVTLDSGANEKLVKVVNGIGEYGFIETELLHPVVFGSDIQKYEVVNANRFIIYPYRNNTTIPESVIKADYPRAFEYLSKYKDVLAARSSITASRLSWHELVRKRDERWLTSPKLIIRDLATETSFAIDPTGNTLLVGGTAVVPADSDLLLPLLGYLNSSIVNQYLRQITPGFKGGFQKFEPQHLQRIPVLKRLTTDDEFANQISREVRHLIDAKAANNEDVRKDAEGRIEALIKEAI